MYIQYGDYRHDMGEAELTISRRPLFNGAKVPYAWRERWEIAGFLHSGAKEDAPLDVHRRSLSARLSAMTAAYSQNGRDIALLADSGGTTAHRIQSANTIGGVRIVEGPSFPEGRGAEYSTFRRYRLTLEADVIDPNGEDLLAWEETVSIQGGGPRFVYLQTLNGPPQKQLTAQATPFSMVQRGRAIGLWSYPAAAEPLWPASEHRERRRVDRQTPRRTGSGKNIRFTEYEITWEYAFESTAPPAFIPSHPEA